MNNIRKVSILPSFSAQCNSEVYEKIYIGCAVPLTISVTCILIIGFIPCCPCRCCCNFEDPEDPTENCIGKIKSFICRHCSPPILEKSYSNFSLRDENPPEVVHLAEKKLSYKGLVQDHII